MRRAGEGCEGKACAAVLTAGKNARMPGAPERWKSGTPAQDFHGNLRRFFLQFEWDGLIIKRNNRCRSGWDGAVLSEWIKE